MFYGIRFLGGNRTCTMGEPNPITGRVSTACEIVTAKNLSTLQTWLDNENLYRETGCGGGERLKISRARVWYHLRGDSVADRLEEIKRAGLENEF